MTDGDRAMHGGPEDTFRDTERALRKKIERLTAEVSKYRASLQAVLNEVAEVAGIYALEKVTKAALDTVSGSSKPDFDADKFEADFEDKRQEWAETADSSPTPTCEHCDQPAVLPTPLYGRLRCKESWSSFEAFYNREEYTGQQCAGWNAKSPDDARRPK